MDELSNKREFSVSGSIDFSKEAVFFDGENDGWTTLQHESILLQKLHTVIDKIGGSITGDEALYMRLG